MDQYVTGAMIRQLREGKGLTQQQLAEKLGVSDKAVSKWETGRSYPDIALLEPIAKELGVSVAQLLSGQTIQNSNIAGNMLRSKLYVCPVCGNIVHSMGEVQVACCGITLPPLEAEKADAAHGFTVEKSEDELFVTVDHEMTKEHYISFFAYVNGDRFELVKLYPEGNAQARFKIRSGGVLFNYCNREGLSMYRPEVQKKWGNTKEYAAFAQREKTEGTQKMNGYGEELMRLFAQIGQYKHLDASDAAVQKMTDGIRQYITDHFYPCSKEVFASLGQMYTADERFKASIDAAGGEGTAEFVSRAIAIYCK